VNAALLVMGSTLDLDLQSWKNGYVKRQKKYEILYSFFLAVM